MGIEFEAWEEEKLAKATIARREALGIETPRNTPIPFDITEEMRERAVIASEIKARRENSLRRGK